MSYVVTYR